MTSSCASHEYKAEISKIAEILLIELTMSMRKNGGTISCILEINSTSSGINGETGCNFYFIMIIDTE